MNQLVSLGVAGLIGLLTMIAVGAATAQTGILTFLFFGHTQNAAYGFVHEIFLQIAVAFLSIGMFFVIYWILPHRRLPIRAVLPTAVLCGLLWDVGRLLYILVLPHMDLHSVYGPFEVSVSLMIWAFLTGLLLLSGAQYSASRHALRLARKADLEAEAAKKTEEKDSPRSPQPIHPLPARVLPMKSAQESLSDLCRATTSPRRTSPRVEHRVRKNPWPGDPHPCCWGCGDRARRDRFCIQFDVKKPFSVGLFRLGRDQARPNT